MPTAAELGRSFISEGVAQAPPQIDVSPTEDIQKIGKDFWSAQALDMPRWLPEEGKQDRGKTFDGGLVADLFDILSLGQYAAAGAVRAAYNGQPIIEGLANGLKSRASVEDILADMGMEPGIGRTAAGLAGDILFDPLWLFKPVTAVKAIGRIGGIGEAFAKGAATVADTKLGKKFLTATTYAYGVPESVKALDLARAENIFSMSEDAIKNLKRYNKLPAEIRPHIESYLETQDALGKSAVFDSVKEGFNSKTSSLFKEYVDNYERLDQAVGKGLVEVGLISRSQFQHMSGRHVRKIYKRFEDVDQHIEDLRAVKDPRYDAIADDLQKQVDKIGNRKDFFKKYTRGGDPNMVAPRVELTADQAKELGEITDIGHRVARSSVAGAQALHERNFINQVMQSANASPNPGPGLVSVGASPKLGGWADHYVPEGVANFLKQTTRTPTDWEKFIQGPLGLWKMFKVAFNPTSYARNWIANIPLMNWAGIPYKDTLLYQGSALKTLLNMDNVLPTNPVDDARKIISEIRLPETVVQPVADGFQRMYIGTRAADKIAARGIPKGTTLFASEADAAKAAQKSKGTKPWRVLPYDVPIESLDQLAGDIKLPKGRVYKPPPSSQVFADASDNTRVFSDDKLESARLIRGSSAGSFVGQELNRHLRHMNIAGSSPYKQGLATFYALGDKAADNYRSLDILGKTAAAHWALDQGMDLTTSLRFADKALFNYAQVPPAVDFLRRNGIVPFASFSYFATSAFARGLWSKPAQISGIGKSIRALNAIDPQSQELRKAAPEWQKGFSQVFLPLTDRHGRKHVLDLTYLLPFGDIITASEGISGPAQLLQQQTSFATFVTDLLRNQNSFTGQPIAPPERLVGKSDEMAQKAATAYIDYVYRFAMPTWMPSIFPWDAKSQKITQGGQFFKTWEEVIAGRPDVFGRKKAWWQAAMAEPFGFKVRPFDLNQERTRRAKDYQGDVRAIQDQMKKVAGDRELDMEEKREIISDLKDDLMNIHAHWVNTNSNGN